jgi:hypothetical protein
MSGNHVGKNLTRRMRGREEGGGLKIEWKGCLEI